MTAGVIFLVMAIISVIIGVASSIGITQYLTRHGVKMNWLLLRVYLIKYIHDYHKMTKEATGRPGPLFYSYVISMNLALVFAFPAIIFK